MMDIEELIRWHEDRARDHSLDYATITAHRETAEALRAQPPAPSAPVAYWLAVQDGCFVEFGIDSDNGNDVEVARKEVIEWIAERTKHLDTHSYRVVGVYTSPRERSPAQANGCHSIEHGEKLFEFTSLADWSDKGQAIWKQHGVSGIDTLCVDQLGRVCGWGKHFTAAEQDDAYPIEVFRLRASDRRDEVAQGAAT